MFTNSNFYRYVARNNTPELLNVIERGSISRIPIRRSYSCDMRPSSHLSGCIQAEIEPTKDRNGGWTPRSCESFDCKVKACFLLKFLLVQQATTCGIVVFMTFY